MMKRDKQENSQSQAEETGLYLIHFTLEFLTGSKIVWAKSLDSTPGDSTFFSS
jgi:hypothetical protein